MFGKNQALSRIDRPSTLTVKEIFYTIQGEGPLAGSPAVFVRMAGCHLKCYFCDTDFENGTDYSPLSLYNEIVSESKGRTNLVVFTGGEPLRQNLSDIFDNLDNDDWRVQIETAGTFWWDWMDMTFWSFSRNTPRGFQIDTGGHQIVVSPKTKTIHPKIAKVANAFKYITRKGDNDDDGLPMYSTQDRNETSDLFRPDETVPKECIYIQPMDVQNEGLNADNLIAATNLALKHGYRLSLQTHKIVGVP